MSGTVADADLQIGHSTVMWLLSATIKLCSCARNCAGDGLLKRAGKGPPQASAHNAQRLRATAWGHAAP